MLRLLTVIHLLSAHATSPPPQYGIGNHQAPPEKGSSRFGPAQGVSNLLSSLVHLSASSRICRSALCVLSGMYAHSPIRGGRNDESSLETPGPEVRRTRLRGKVKAPASSFAGRPSKGIASRRRQRSANAPELPVAGASVVSQEGAGHASTHKTAADGTIVPAQNEITCAVESPDFFGAGHMKKWRGQCKDASDLMDALVLHFCLREQATTSLYNAEGMRGRPGSLLLQFFDRELMEYIDLEESTWQDFVSQVRHAHIFSAFPLPHVDFFCFGPSFAPSPGCQRFPHERCTCKPCRQLSRYEY